MSDLVSIIVPVYNVEKYIAQCIESILVQDYKEIELILVNDGSPDKSGNICDMYAEKDKRIKVIHKENGGVSSARNAGIESATGKYMMFVDGDDWLEINAVSRMVNHISQKQVDVCFSNSYYKDNEIIRQPFPFDEDIKVQADEALKEHLKYRMSASTCLAIYNLSSIDKVKFDVNIHTLEDWEYLFRIILASKKICVVNECFYHYRTVIGSASKSTLNEKKMTMFLIPEKVRAVLRDKHCNEALKFAEGLEAILINHIMVIRCNSGVGKNIYEKEIRTIARKNLFRSLKCPYLLRRQKIYCLMVALHPAIFEFAYKIKYKGK